MHPMWIRAAASTFDVTLVVGFSGRDVALLARHGLLASSSVLAPDGPCRSLCDAVDGIHVYRRLSI